MFSNVTDRSTLGASAEQLIAVYLEKQGYTILERNYKKKYGEIDLIAQHNDMLVFVEVKMRTSNHFDMAQLISPAKQKKIIKTASMYIASNKQEDKMCRFDVALVQLNNTIPEIQYLPDAFSAWTLS